MQRIPQVDYIELINKFKNEIEKATRRYDYYYAKVNEYDKASDDILHQLELGSRKEASKWTKELSEIRKARRYAKDMVTKLYPIKQYFLSNYNDMGKLSKLVGDIRKEEASLKGRTYTPKIIKNLTIGEPK